MTDLTPVPVAVACRCPGTPHDGDSVYLRPKLGLHAGMVAQRKVIDLASGGSESADADEIMASLAEVFCRYGVIEWTFTDEDGKPVPVTPENVQEILLDDFGYGFPVADRAADLYTSGLLDPLLAKVSKSSPSTSTGTSTSAANGSSATRQKRSKRSSITSIPTADTATTSK